VLDPRLDNRPCGGKYGDIVQAIGNTPLVELRRLSPKPGVRIYVKLEGYNPTGSVKDRVARSMIERAEEEGQIAPGQTILEPTSGNTGISLAMICRRKGYPLKVVMPDNVTAERTQLLQMYGAEIVYSPGEQGSNGAVAMALEMAAADSSYYMPYQYGNQANPDAHYNGTAAEILEELDGVAAFVAGLGTGGTLMGNARRFKEEDPDTQIVAAEPLQGELVQGLRSLEDGTSRRSSTSRCSTGRSSSRTATPWSGPRSCSTRRASSRASRQARLRRSACAWRTSSTRATWSSCHRTTAGST
jgi:[CysO sulfur-carrier protein]-thiocarboxylate-dependent cysteine synthase